MPKPPESSFWRLFSVRTSLVLTICALGLGCAIESRTVYVDVASITKTESVMVWPKPPTPPLPPAPKAAQKFVLPGRAPKLVADPANTEGLDIESQFEGTRKKALAELTKRLRQYYRSQSDRFARDLERDLKKFSAEKYSITGERLESLFRSYADERGPLITRIATLQGYPVGNPESASSTASLLVGSPREMIELAELKVELAELQAQFDLKAKAVFQIIEDEVARERLQNELKLIKRRDELDEQAVIEAQRLVRQAVLSINLKLLERKDITLPEVPEQTIQIPAEERLPAVPTLKRDPIFESKTQVRREIEADLGIWLTLKGYTLVKQAGKARNATNEFASWRKKEAAGLSEN